MIDAKTVFVIGAGASTNFGLPVGAKLKTAISALMSHQLTDDRRGIEGDFARIFYSARTALREGTLAGYQEDDLLEAAREIAAAMPLAHSIDNYLDAHRNNPVINIVGKLAISQAILNAEGNSSLTDPDPSNIYNTFDFSRNENTWINALLRKLSENVPRSDVYHLFDNVAIITFNYDRCIEQFLFYAVQRYYKINAEEAARILEGLLVVHTYGQVGRLKWQDSELPHIAYGDGVNGDLVGSALRISTFTESREDREQKVLIDLAFKDTHRIVFLGFSFQEQNVRLLPEIFNDVAIVGTAKGMSPTNLEVIAAKLREHFTGTTGTTVRQLSLDREYGAESFIDNYWRVID